LRRTLVLSGLVALGVALVVVVRPPVRETGREAVRGQRVLRLRDPVVERLEVELGDRRFTARPTGAGWEIDGRPASRGTTEALGSLLDTLVELRAVDAFHPRDGSSYGLDRPRGTIAVTTDRGTSRLVLGDWNAAGSTIYARRGTDTRVLRVGIYLLSTLERVFYHRDLADPPAGEAASPPT